MTGATRAKLPTWNLGDFYSGFNSKEVAGDIRHAESLVKKFAKDYEDRVGKLGIKEFTRAVEEYEGIGELLGKLGSYAQLLYAGDMSKPEIAQFYQNIQE